MMHYLAHLATTKMAVFTLLTLHVSASWVTHYVHPTNVCQLYCGYCHKHVGQDPKLCYDMSACSNDCEERMGTKPDKTCTNDKYIRKRTLTKSCRRKCKKLLLCILKE